MRVLEMPPKKQNGFNPIIPTTNITNMDPYLPDDNDLASVDEMCQYNQEQQDEFTALESIYQDAFQKLEGKAAAWQVSNSMHSALNSADRI